MTTLNLGMGLIPSLVIMLSSPILATPSDFIIYNSNDLRELARRLSETIPPQSPTPSAKSTTAQNALITSPPIALELRQNNPQDCQNLITASVNRATVEISRTIIALNATFSQQLRAASISASNGIKSAQDSATSTISIVVQSASIATVAAFSSVTVANRAITSANLALTDAQLSASTALSVANQSIAAATSSLAIANSALSGAQASITSVISVSSSDVSRLSASLTLLEASVSSIQASAISAIAAAQLALASVTGSAAAQASAILASAASATQNRPGPQTVFIGSPSSDGQPLTIKSPTAITPAQIVAIAIGAVIVSILLGATVYFIITKRRRRKQTDSYLDEKNFPTSPRKFSFRLGSTSRNGDTKIFKTNPLQSSNASFRSKSLARQREDSPVAPSPLENPAPPKIDAPDVAEIGIALPSPYTINWPLQMDQITDSIGRDDAQCGDRLGVEGGRIEDTAPAQPVLNPFVDQTEVSSVEQPVSHISEDHIISLRTKVLHDQQPINPFEDPVTEIPTDLLEAPRFKSAGDVAVNLFLNDDSLTANDGAFQFSFEQPLPQNSSESPLDDVAVVAIEDEPQRTSTMPEIDTLLRIVAQQNEETADKPLFWSDFRPLNLTEEQALASTSEPDMVISQRSLSIVATIRAITTDDTTNNVRSPLKSSAMESGDQIHLGAVLSNPLILLSEAEIRQQSIADEATAVSTLDRNPPMQNIASLLMEQESSESNNSGRGSRGRSMLRTSDIIEARSSFLARSKAAEKEIEENNKRERDRTMSPLRRNPVNFNAVPGQTTTERTLSPLQRNPSNPPTLRRNPPTNSQEPIIEIVRGRTESPLRRNPFKGSVLRFPVEVPISTSQPPARSYSVPRPASNAAFAQSLSKFRTLAAQDATEARQATSEVTQRAIAGIFIPGSLREQAVRNLSKSRERGKTIGNASRSVSKVDEKRVDT